MRLQRVSTRQLRRYITEMHINSEFPPSRAVAILSSEVLFLIHEQMMAPFFCLTPVGLTGACLLARYYCIYRYYEADLPWLTNPCFSDSYLFLFILNRNLTSGVSLEASVDHFIPSAFETLDTSRNKESVTSQKPIRRPWGCAIISKSQTLSSGHYEAFYKLLMNYREQLSSRLGILWPGPLSGQKNMR